MDDWQFNAPLYDPPRRNAAPWIAGGLVIGALLIAMAIVAADAKSRQDKGKVTTAELKILQQPAEVPKPAPQPRPEPPKHFPPPTPPARKRIMADDEGRDWSLRDMQRHLEAAGIQFQVAERFRSGIQGIWLTASEGNRKVAVQIVRFEHPDHIDQSLQEDQPPRGERIIKWGCFLIVGPPSKLLDSIQAALK